MPSIRLRVPSKQVKGDVYIAGGVESMSRAPYSLPKAEAGYSFGNLTAYDTALGWRYPNPKMKEMYGTDSMGETAENIAKERPHITREKQDAFSVRSHQLAIAAIDSGRFKQEIIPVSIPQKKGDPKIVDTDERPRRDTTMESLAKLKPAFAKEGGTVTAGNSSGLNDGAAALLIMSEEKAKALNLKPLARIVTSASAGVPPRVMGYGPIPATKKALERAGLQMKDIGLMELNEAFAVQSLAVIEDLEIDPELVNVNGGAIAIGHPLGCSGARLVTTLVHEMKNRGNVKYGVATLCVGVGQGEATVIEYLGVRKLKVESQKSKPRPSTLDFIVYGDRMKKNLSLLLSIVFLTACAAPAVESTTEPAQPVQFTPTVSIYTDSHIHE